MSVTCALFGPMRDPVGQKHVELDVDTPIPIREVIDALLTAEPGLGQYLDEIEETRSITVTVDGTHIDQRDGFDTLVTDDDIVRLTQPVVGGC